MLKRKNGLYGFIILFFLLACKTSYCPEDKSSIDLFMTQLRLLKSAEEDKADVLVDDYRYALLFLSNVTGITTKAEYSSTFGYRSKKAYSDDMRAWQTWLTKNRCRLSKVYIDSAMGSTTKQ